VYGPLNGDGIIICGFRNGLGNPGFKTLVKVLLKCVIGGIRDPKFVSRAIQWVDQTNGRAINTFKYGRRITEKVNLHLFQLNPRNITGLIPFKERKMNIARG